LDRVDEDDEDDDERRIDGIIEASAGAAKRASNTGSWVSSLHGMGQGVFF
jgi:hypothetical protein